MLRKLAIRNVRRQLGNYLIYFMTLALVTALLFAVNNIIYSDNLAVFVVDEEEAQMVLAMATVLISAVVAFVLSYAGSFMLRLRKQEFGMYLTLGMSRGDILKLFFLENSVICIAALGVGAAAGLFFFQGFTAVLMNLLEIEFTIAAYSPEGMLRTALLVAGVFFFASLASAFYLKRVSIYGLLHGAMKVERKVKHPYVWFVVMAVSLAMMAICGLAFFREVDAIMLEGHRMDKAMGLLLILGIFLLLFHMGLAKGLVSVLLRRPGLCSRGAGTFVLRQLSGTLSINSLMLGCLAFLLSFAVIGADTSFIAKTMLDDMLDQEAPYDILCHAEKSKNSGFLEEAEKVAGEYMEIRERLSYGIYRSGGHEFNEFTGWYQQYVEEGRGWADFQDVFMKLSDFNKIITPLGYEPVFLEGRFLIVGTALETSQLSWSDMIFEHKGKKYAFQDCRTDYPLLCYERFYVILLDEAVADMECHEEYAAYRTAGVKYDAAELWERLHGIVLRYRRDGGAYNCGFVLREYSKLEKDESAAVLVLGALFTAGVFLLLAMAILALKTLSAMGEDRRRYEILFRLGLGEEGRSRALFWQTFSFFLLPFAVPIAMGIPAAMVGQRIMELGNMEGSIDAMPVIAGSVAFVMAAVYLLYYMAAYLIAKRAVRVG
ncbi:ABC transporter permease [bacterium D16-50]|nr:ABC transporter permease [bacterium D16-50]